MKHENGVFVFAHLACRRQGTAISHNTEASSQDDLSFRQRFLALPYQTVVSKNRTFCASTTPFSAPI